MTYKFAYESSEIMMTCLCQWPCIATDYLNFSTIAPFYTFKNVAAKFLNIRICNWLEYVCSSRIITHRLCKITHYVTNVKMLSSAGLNDFSYVKLSYLTNDLPFGKLVTRILIWSWSYGGETHFLSASVLTIALLSCNSKIDRTVNCSVLQCSPTCTIDFFVPISVC